jgi:hypothetical protein
MQYSEMSKEDTSTIYVDVLLNISKLITTRRKIKLLHFLFWNACHFSYFQKAAAAAATI